jgi:hypothetical protein
MVVSTGSPFVIAPSTGIYGATMSLLIGSGSSISIGGT